MKDRGAARTGDKETIRTPISYLGRVSELGGKVSLRSWLGLFFLSLGAHQTHVTLRLWINGSQHNAESRWARRRGEIRTGSPAVRGAHTSCNRHVFVPQFVYWILSVRLRTHTDPAGSGGRRGSGGEPRTKALRFSSSSRKGLVRFCPLWLWSLSPSVLLLSAVHRSAFFFVPCPLFRSALRTRRSLTTAEDAHLPRRLGCRDICSLGMCLTMEMVVVGFSFERAKIGAISSSLTPPPIVPPIFPLTHPIPTDSLLPSLLLVAQKLSTDAVLPDDGRAAGRAILPRADAPGIQSEPADVQ